MRGVGARFVYILRSDSDPERHSTRYAPPMLTNGSRAAPTASSGYTKKSTGSWSVSVIGIPDEAHAARFERYLKTGWSRVRQRHFYDKLLSLVVHERRSRKPARCHLPSDASPHRLLLLAVSGCSPLATPRESSGSNAACLPGPGTSDKDADDFLAVIDVDRRSATYGQVLRTLPAPGGRGAHHVEYEMSTSQLFANSFETGHTFVFDLSDPMHPRLFSDFGDAGPYSHPHSFARTPSGTVLATYQGLAADHRATGGLVELDDRGRMLRAASAANSVDRDLRPYSLAGSPNSTALSQRRPTCTD